MRKIGAVVVDNAILCDDVRKEENGKSILIGVYSGDIVVSEIPAFAQLAFYLEMTAPPGDHHLEIRLSGPGEGSAVLAVQVEQPEDGRAVLASPRITVALEQEGIFKIDARALDGRWSNIITKRVKMAKRPE